MTKCILFTLPFLLAACAATVQVGPTGLDPDPPVVDGEMPTNEVLIYRPANQIGLATTVFAEPAIMINDNNVGDCQAGKPLLVRLPEGRWTVRAITSNEQVAQTVTVEDFDTAYLRCGVTVSSSPTLVRVTRAVAEAEGGI